MLQIGLISEQKTGKPKGFLSRPERVRISHEKNPFEMLIEEVAVSLENAEALPSGRLQRKMKSAARRLEREGAEYILFSKALSPYARREMSGKIFLEREKGRELATEFLPSWIRNEARKCEIEIPVREICIRVNEMDRITESLVSQFCFFAKKIVVCTQKSRKAENFARNFFEENGLKLKIVNEYCDECCDVLVDVDMPSVRIGRGVEKPTPVFDFEFCGYEPNMMEVAACLKEKHQSFEFYLHLLDKKS